jgi:hypothetical protein
MDSFVFLVTVIFLSVALSGPLSLLASYFNLYFLTILLAILSFVGGGLCCCMADFPGSIIGCISVICGVLALRKVF